MRLWLLRPVNWDQYRDSYDGEGLDKRFSWDCTFGFVVRAGTEAEARAIAQNAGADETSGAMYEEIDTWLDPAVTTCLPLRAAGEAGVVMNDFHAG